MKLLKEIRSLGVGVVRCEAECCEEPARFLFVAGGSSNGRWAYCEEHARVRAVENKLELPAELSATAGAA